MHESSYWGVYHLSSIFNVYIYNVNKSLIRVENKPYVIESLIDEELDFRCMRAQEQVREQVSTSVQQRDELDSRINVIFYHLFRSNAV